jgi:hypothetical protein
MGSDWRPRISASCPECGEVALAPQELTLVLPIWDAGRDWSYRFECPACGGVVSRGMTRWDLELLVSVGIEVDFELDGPTPELPGSPGVP